MHQGRSHHVKDIQIKPKRWNYGQPAYFPTNNVDILTAVCAVFSGSKAKWASVETEPSALSHDGVCVYFRALENLNLSPEESTIVRVVAGPIEFEGAKYESIHDLIADAGLSDGDYGPHVSYNLLVQEAPQPGTLAAAYEISFNARSYEHLIGISRLERAIAKSIQAPIQCVEHCDWSTFYQGREAVILVPKYTTQKASSLGEPLPLVPK
ncbi:hypothetical protein GJ744_009690 [Endocarpon pusillum]|uniref:Uncharacterized protein n=1 Tax=Endocarpon pusillum TaxID=364733 RepID=A0A8H7ARY8_9EURO|nr:hypothetical protein GJ744_009690 [Endocarpon pusillum]